MSTVTLILAAGEQARWKMNEPPYYKQLLDVGGETIIKRVWRQCRARGSEPSVITHNSEFVQTLSFAPERHRWTVETLLSTCDLWQPRTIVLLGDVIYSKATMDRIFNAPNQALCVFGNLVEIYALVMQVPGEHTRGRLIDILNKSVAYAERMTQLDSRRGHGSLRKFYQRYCGLDLNNAADIEDKVLQWVDGLDYTRDVDWPRDYEALQREVVDVGRLDDLLDANPCIDIYEWNGSISGSSEKWSKE